MRYIPAHSIRSKFFITEENARLAFDAIMKELEPKTDAKDFQELLTDFGWQTLHEGSGYGWLESSDCDHDYEYDEKLLGLIAPYAEPGSYVVMTDENYNFWCWYMDGKLVTDDTPSMTFPKCGVSIEL